MKEIEDNTDKWKHFFFFKVVYYEGKYSQMSDRIAGDQKRC